MHRVDRLKDRRERARKVAEVVVVVALIAVVVLLAAAVRSAATTRQRAVSVLRLQPLRMQVASARAENAELSMERDRLVRANVATVSASLTTYNPRKMVPVPRTIRTAPVPAQAKPPGAGSYTSLGVFKATAYCLTGTTASGAQAGPGRIAVDPSVIPLGTKLYVEGYGQCVAVDTGGAIKGRIIDVWYADRAQCLRWGRRSVNVWRVN